MANFAEDDFEVLYPGVYTAREAHLVDRLLKDCSALASRGWIDPKQLVEGKLPDGIPGVGPVQKVTEAMSRYCSTIFDPENALLHDAQYARARGFKDILAMPCFGTHDDTFHAPWPPDARDTLMVSQLEYAVTSHLPVYPGDTLYLVTDGRTISERTPAEGATKRTVEIHSKGSVYNQAGGLVNEMTERVSETVGILKPERRPERLGFDSVWDAPDWGSRPQHYYTDDDWAFIRGIWATEKRQGRVPLYWEDVNVGDEPTWTADGPIEVSVLPTPFYGMGTGGSRTMKREIMDPAVFKTMVRGESDGIYRLADRSLYVPPVPDGAMPAMMIEPDESGSGEIRTADIHKAGTTRTPLINHHGRDIAVRHISNWMGDQGWLRNIRWGIMPAETMAAHGKPVPKNPALEDFLGHVPSMSGRRVEVHGLTGDLALVKSYVYDKYVQGHAFLIDLAFWIENIEGQVWLAGGATVQLPSTTHNHTRSGPRVLDVYIPRLA
ncbi:MAG: hypothetical protein JW990_04125 [Thermoleophilia bacterium]|nr:hypothetical protein [Thermoleophilia bacterium]